MLSSTKKRLRTLKSNGTDEVEFDNSLSTVLCSTSLVGTIGRIGRAQV